MKPLEEGMLCVGNEKVEAAVLPERMGRGSVLIAGTIPENLEGWLEERGIRCLCYLEQEDYLIKNAHLTAEGALYLALGHMEKTLWGSKVLVTGWGRIGKFLIPMLKQLGAEITVGVRKEAQKSLLEAMGYHVVTTGQFGSGLANYDLIINTVPGAVFSRDSIDSISLDCVLVELASLPGAFPEEIKNRVIFAPGLPGRTCPVTAGEILGKVVMDCLEGKGMNME